MSKIGDKIAKMTLRQKADMLTGRDFWSTQEYEELGIPSIFLADGPHGIRKQAAASDHLGLNPSLPATCFPTAAAMANSWDPELGEQLGERLGQEACSMGVNVLLGPGMNIKRNPLCGRNFEYFSEDPYLSGKMAAAYVRGIQKSGISACIKHFAANNQEERRMVIDTVVDERTLREIYLTGFEIAVREGKPWAVMSSYNKLNGEFTNENIHLMQEILRGEWGYRGIVVSDWAGCNDRIKGVKAGNELEMPACKYGADDIVAAVESGALDEKSVDECLERLLLLVSDTAEAVARAPKTFEVDEHHAFARRCAQECAVLLKNERNSLPLDKRERVCFIGDFARTPRYQGAGSSVVNPTRLENAFECCTKEDFNFIGFAPGYERYGKANKRLKNEALKLADFADTVVFFAGLDEVSETEGIDRHDLRLPQNQLDVLSELNKLGKKVVVVLCCGSAVEMDIVSDANAVLFASLGGQAGARAVIDILTGKINPSGKLAESYPLRYVDCSSASHFPGKAVTVEYREGLFVGYRHYITAGVSVRYPFGYGLSYTQFEYSDLQITEKGVSFVLKNAGDRDGAEIAQLYIGKKQTDLFRPARELKGFARVFLKAGESRRIEIPFNEYTFRYFNIKTDRWETEPGSYEVYIGASSEDMRLIGVWGCEGRAAPVPYDREKLPSYYSGKAEDVGREEFTELLGRELPPAGFKFYKKQRMVIHENCTVVDLRFSRRWVGRLFSWVIRFAHSFLWKTGRRMQANTIMMGVYHQPIRGLAKYGGMSRRQMEAILMMCNGHLCKGIVQFLKKDRRKKRKGKR